ncbi:uncharacterized protein LOC109850555 [Asparagus officinalis]|nr:uncharacterized protein LOC109850555 [Asparagus officinalis]
MISADELFLDGKIRPMKLSSHLQRPQHLAPLLDLNEEDEDEAREGEMSGRSREVRLRSRSMHRRARSMSPMRNSRFQWQDEEEEEEKKDLEADPDLDLDPTKESETVTPSDSSASSSRSSSSVRNSKRWIFLKDFLYRSKSEGGGRTNAKEKEKEKEKEKFWNSISFTPSKVKDAVKSPAKTLKKPTNGVGKRRGPLPSAHERHYTAKRAQAEEMRKRTFLPYRQGLLGCLGFSSRSYGAMNGFARTLNPVSSG